MDPGCIFSWRKPIWECEAPKAMSDHMFIIDIGHSLIEGQPIRVDLASKHF
jgi:hypothetical protein